MWASVKEMFEGMEKCEYVILRNWEEFPEALTLNGHEDIDLLCSDVEQTIQAMKAVPIRKSNVHFAVTIGQRTISVDIRHIGDGYYDKDWETDMLFKRQKFKDLCYVLDSENYFFSLLYHALIQKPFIKEDYIERLTKFRGGIERKEFENILNEFLRRKDYRATNTEDVQVFLNFSCISPELIYINPKWKWERIYWEKKLGCKNKLETEKKQIIELLVKLKRKIWKK